MTAKFESGSLRSVRMVNFMKHSNLCIDLTPRVNFITGRNGSGKSSILVAISVGLGCNSRLSGRGSNLADLIKDGQNKAIITITIQNGPEGYNYEVYGDTIVIKRSITKSSNSFEIEGFKSRNQTQVKEELERIRSYYNIQIDNPCSIMHQDTAREFIGTSTPNRKYELFMRGTLLSHLSEEITSINQDIKNIKIQREQRLEEKKDLDSEFEKQQSLYQIVLEADSIHKRIHDLEDELVWSHYNEANNKVEEAKSKLNDMQRQQEAKQLVVEEKRQKKAEAEAKFEENQAAMREANAQINQIKQEISQLIAKLSPIKAQLAQLKAQKEHRNNSIQSLQRDISQKQNEYERLSSKKDRIMQEAEQKRRKYIEVRQTKIQELEPLINELEQKIQEISADLKNIQSAESQLKQKFNEMDYQCKTTKQKLDDLIRSSQLNDGSSPAFSGRGFNFKPIGPLMKYVHMKPDYTEWNIAAQHIIGKALNMYIVHSRQDEQQLRKTNHNASIIITNFTTPRYDIGNPAPPCPGAKRIIDVLNFKDEEIVGSVNRQQFKVHTSDIIFNVIVDQYNADRTWCVENEISARETAFRNLAPCTITKAGVQYKIQNTYEVRLGATHKSSRIGQDESERIAQLQNEYDHLHQHLIQVRNDLNTVSSDLRRKKQDRQRNESEYNQKQKELNRTRAELQNPPSEGTDIDDKLQSIQDQINYSRKKLEEEQNEIPNIEKQYEEKTAAKKEIKDEIQATKEKLTSNSINKTLNDRLYTDLHTLDRQYQNESRELEEIRKKAQRLEDDMKQKEAEAQTIYEKAKKHSPEKETVFKDNPPRSTAVLSQLLNEERKKYADAQQARGLDFNAVRQDYNKLKKEMQKAESYLTDLSEFIDHANEALKMRENKLNEMRHSITRRTKVSFMQYQSKRKYTGKLRFDHDKRVIDIAVKQKADSEFTDVSNLSGGEKSFCLVSLLLSLWDVMECPFYCVDEFDVFMDDINRQAATSLLVSGAQTMSTRQFIFITPLSLDHLKSAGSEVSIFEVTS